MEAPLDDVVGLEVLSRQGVALTSELENVL
jgi:hypothetical protein